MFIYCENNFHLIQSKGGGNIADAVKTLLNFILMLVITFILALIFLIIIAFVVKLTGNLVFGLENDMWKEGLAGFGIIAAAIVAGAAVIGGKSDITIIN